METGFQFGWQNIERPDFYKYHPASSLPKKWAIGVCLLTTSLCVQISRFANAKFIRSQLVFSEIQADIIN
jgi:hypothetical protein